MTKPWVAITGAHSYLGQQAVKTLVASGNYRVLALVSPRWRKDSGPALDQARVVSVDLTRTLPGALRKELGAAQRIFHFAWVRGKKIDRVNETNESMINRLVDPLPDPARFFFISSVAGCPGALSGYGSAKALATQQVIGFGGSALLCGLVVDRVPRGPYKMLCSAIKKLPVRLRLARGGPCVLPIDLGDVGAGVQAACEQDLEPAVYRLFGDLLTFNDFMALLETIYPRKRVTLPLSADLILTAAHRLKRAHLAPFGLCDKILTFLYKDEAYLRSHRAIPGLHLKPCNRDLLA